MSAQKQRAGRQAGESDKLAAEKKQLVLGDKGKKKTGLMALALVVVLAGAAALVLWSGQDPAPGSAAQAAQSQPAAQGGVVSFAVADFADGKARHFEYQAPGGITVRYFIIKSSDGVIRAAFDACDVCWRAGKGYTQDGDEMICNNCGRRFASVKINEVKGGCNPAPLKRQMQGDQVVIQVADILEGRRYFDF